MRFSSIFQLPLPAHVAAVPPAPARVEEPLPPTVATETPTRELPEALDERVRLVGEWQLGDA